MKRAGAPSETPALKIQEAVAHHGNATGKANNGHFPGFVKDGGDSKVRGPAEAGTPYRRRPRRRVGPGEALRIVLAAAEANARGHQHCLVILEASSVIRDYFAALGDGKGGKSKSSAVGFQKTALTLKAA